jgi:hypothetical protein
VSLVEAFIEFADLVEEFSGAVEHGHIPQFTRQCRIRQKEI